MRIDKFIGNNSAYSRSEIHSAIKCGQVFLNGETVSKAGQQVAAGDKISIAGALIEERKPRYLMLHKPAGYVCANQDSDHPTVLDLIALPFKEALQIAGRLDLDTTGLVLITDDGNWNHKITSPRHSHTKTYLVTTADPISNDSQHVFSEGILLKGETKRTLPADLQILDSHRAKLIICEGKYHQVKRMFAALGNRVVSLHRERIGHIVLDKELQAGQYRSLSNDEINGF